MKIEVLSTKDTKSTKEDRGQRNSLRALLSVKTLFFSRISKLKAYKAMIFNDLF